MRAARSVRTPRPCKGCERATRRPFRLGLPVNGARAAQMPEIYGDHNFMKFQALAFQHMWSRLDRDLEKGIPVFGRACGFSDEIMVHRSGLAAFV